MTHTAYGGRSLRQWVWLATTFCLFGCFGGRSEAETQKVAEVAQAYLVSLRYTPVVVLCNDISRSQVHCDARVQETQAPISIECFGDDAVNVRCSILSSSSTEKARLRRDQDNELLWMLVAM